MNHASTNHASAGDLHVLSAEESCECLPGSLWQTFVGAGAWAMFVLSLAWLGQAVMEGAPAAAWWKSMLSLGCVLAFTYAWRVARRLDAHAKQGWSISDVALLLAGAFIAGVFVMRGTAWVGAGLIALFIVVEGLSLWRLKLIPSQLLSIVDRRIRRRGPSIEPESEIIPIRTLTGEALAANVLTSSGEDDPAVSQQFTRRETKDGVEISGFVRGRIEAGEFLASVDIAFCPTLAGEPALDFETICDEELQVHVATLRPYGARLDLKRKGDVKEILEFTVEIHTACEASDDATAIRERVDS